MDTVKFGISRGAKLAHLANQLEAEADAKKTEALTKADKPATTPVETGEDVFALRKGTRYPNP